MHILFVLHIPYAIEPHGVMLLSALCKEAGHKTSLVILKNSNLTKCVKDLNPDVVAYSVMGSDVEAFRRADQELQAYLASSGRRVFRIMGGPTATFNPEVFEEFKLDAICQGDGDRAFPVLLARLEKNESLEGIPNIGLSREGAPLKERLEGADLDNIPFADRSVYYDAVPYALTTGLRSFLTSRGCVYKCTHCYNNIYNEIFSGCGPIIKRRSVDNVLAEIEHVIERYPPVRFIRFFDDVFCLQVDDWLEEFAREYPARIGIPFYCMVRPNNFNEEVARLLKQAGCYSLSMAIETGNETVRNAILRRGLSNKQIEDALSIAHQYGFRTFGNTMIAIPGSTLKDDFQSLDYVRKLNLTVPSFTMCSPVRGTALARYALEKGYIESGAVVMSRYGGLSPLNCYTKREKDIQLRMVYLGTLYAAMPSILLPAFRKIITWPVPPWLVTKFGLAFTGFRITICIFPHIIPRRLLSILRFSIDGIRYSLLS